MKVFISYSWDSESHKIWVENLASKLRKDGIDIILDQYELNLGKNLNHFMERSVDESDRVLLILTENYKKKSDDRKGGVGYEYSLINNEIYKNQLQDKFIPILKSGSFEESTPIFMAPYIGLDMSADVDFETKYEQLLRDLYNEPKIKKPELGQKPNFSILSDIEDKSQISPIKSDNNKSTIQLIIEGEDYLNFDKDHLQSILSSILKVDKSQIKVVKVIPGSIKVRLELKRPASVRFSEIYQKRESILIDLKEHYQIIDVEWWDEIETYRITPEDKENNIPQVYFQSASELKKAETFLPFTSERLAQELLREFSGKSRLDAKSLWALFKLLIPKHFKDIIKSRANILWTMDVETASYPWEMFIDIDNDQVPTFVNVGLIRNIKTEYYKKEFRTTIKTNTALVIGGPNTRGNIEQIPGATREAILVNGILKKKNYNVDFFSNSNSAKIITGLISRENKIIHLTGRGVYNSISPSKSGMVLGDGLYLTVFEIQQLPVPPEFVFVNCCHLGSISSEDEKYMQNSSKFAVNIGTELIKTGVKAVVVAGWTVYDDASQMFTKEIYSLILDGYNFGKAVQMARQRCYHAFPEVNTWGAFQCYGNPWFQLQEIIGWERPELRIN